MNDLEYLELLQDSMTEVTSIDSFDRHVSVDSDDDFYVSDSEMGFAIIDSGGTSDNSNNAKLEPATNSDDSLHEPILNRESATEENATKATITVSDTNLKEITSDGRIDGISTEAPRNTEIGLTDVERFHSSDESASIASVAHIATAKSESTRDHTVIEGPNTINPISSSTPLDNDQPVTHCFNPAPVSKVRECELMHSIKGLYRLLDIYSEEGSGGLVDKIIIDQESSGKFINHLSPGAYRSLTKVDFKAMDGVNIKPVGLYGSKVELIRFFKQLNVIDNDTGKLLREPYDGSRTKPTLRPGLYGLVVRSDVTSDRIIYIVFWPEEKTWHDDASSSVCKNRTMFMRYLTKLTDQIFALVSEEHGRKLIWENSEAPVEDETNTVLNEELEGPGRLFAFEVSKAKEQEESVRIRKGFSIKSSYIQKYVEPKDAFDLGIDARKLMTRLVSGDCNQAVLTASYNPPKTVNRDFEQTFLNNLQLKERLFQSGRNLRLSRSLSINAIQTLIENGLKELYLLPVSSFQDRLREADKKYEFDKKEKNELANKGMQSYEKQIRSAIRMRLLNLILVNFPKLGSTKLRSVLGSGSDEEEGHNNEEYPETLIHFYPNLRTELEKVLEPSEVIAIRTRNRVMSKAIKKVFICNHLFSSYELSTDQQSELWKLISKGIDEKDVTAAVEFCKKNGISNVESKSTPRKIRDEFFSFLSSDAGNNPVNDAANATSELKSVEFYRDVDRIVEKWPVLIEGAMEALQIAQNHYSEKIDGILKCLPHRLLHAHTETLKSKIKKECESNLKKAREEALDQLSTEIEEHYASERDSPQTLVLKELEVRPQPSYGYSYSYMYDYSNMNRNKFRCAGYEIVQTPPSITYNLLLLELPEEDKHRMQSDAQHIPRPQLRDRSSYQFSVPADSEIRHIQLLPKEKCLLILEDDKRNFDIYLEPLENLSSAVSNNRPKTHIYGEKLGTNAVITYDETKRTLIVCTSDIHKPSLLLHTFVFDEAYTKLSAQGSATELAHWYKKMPQVFSVHISPGSEELALVEACGRVRMFSPNTQQFRSSVLELSGPPIATYSTPDGSCLATVLEREDGQLTMQVYHWASLGSRGGFNFDLPMHLTHPQALIVSSLGERKNVQLIWTCIEGKTCNSLILDIKCQVTEYQFVEKSEKCSRYNAKKTFHNSLLDCHPDVWNRFPVVPAFRREIFTFGNSRRKKLLLFVTDADVRFPLTSYFRDLIVNFEKVTKKPVDRVLKDIAVQQNTFLALFSDIHRPDSWNNVSTFKAGEWMVDFFCLIPIQIAIARDNRFIPLKDGVWSSGKEKALLGANINQVADSLSIGWYESILQSYMTSKPVKVVSTMGEQSVGKSFALNHFMDSSFAGSAMRTTEGVWMSVTPTDAELIVSMNFEGVHSIERSSQEDTLLVLFNAAISNLVLFMNNVALSKEITNLFQSFQSSSSFLDPDVNPTLFQATLDIIIKDVVDSDRVELNREFELKLRKIVQEEQTANFITKLYHNNVNIIPWPVIESRQFHTLFNSLRQQLEKQVPTHEGGGKFLAKLKMLMAKLKTNDWGALSQNMSVYRAQQLLSLVSNALMHGASGVEPYIDPLKNLDTSEVIDMPDSDVSLWLESRGPNSGDLKEEALSNLIKRWSGYEARSQQSDKEWMEGLTLFIQSLVEQRIAHVQTWINTNISQQTATNSTVEELWRTLDSKIVELKRNVEICALRCENCRLLCVKARFHSSDHDCKTDHKCPHSCQFVDEHNGVVDKCSLGAGHDGFHICDPTAHLCGHPCNLNGRKGCQSVCTKVANHEESEHMCAAKRHLCGKSCSLQDIRTPGGGLFSCQNYCSIEWDEEHELCVCDASNACPIACQLCGRLCSSTDHLHGLEKGVAHLCGQEHNCTNLCGSAGECEVDTVPQSIEATFNGAHDGFQYTKYSQVTKRLRCAIAIPPGELSHDGPHIHSMAEQVFHYCDVRCGNCGYVCTLPHGHPQPEHSTGHGSMSKTRWAIDGPSGSIFELDGHKFGSSDDGAPMLCNLLCSNMGRHVHIDYCRSADVQSCNEEGTNHIHSRVEPNPDSAKDWITHKLYWQRLDPSSREERSTFAKCDAMCSGPEHQTTATNAAQPSYCTQPMFHRSAAQNSALASGYVSKDGHTFVCKNPAILSQAFHVIFVIDRSESMTLTDRRPPSHHPAYASISRAADNRLGAVFSALHSFWSARAAASNQTAGTRANRRDAYSVILFDRIPTEIVQNDFFSSPDHLLSKVLPHSAGGGTNFDRALAGAERVMERCWSTERAPVIIFLSDGECSVNDKTVYSLCRKAVSLGKALSFHAVSFGPDGYSQWLRRMVTIAQEVQRGAPRDPLIPENTIVEPSYSVALDSIRLNETFLGLADSLRKSRDSTIVSR